MQPSPYLVPATMTTARDLPNQTRLRTARALARGGWALISVAPGVALALAQYASLAHGDPDPLDGVATVIALGGVGLAALAWLWWVVVHVGARRAGALPDPPPYRDSTGFLAFCGWLALVVGGMVVMALGGDADTVAPPALLALGLGCACAIGGFLGFLRASWRWLAAELREGRRVEAAVRAAAAARGLDEGGPPRALVALCGLAALVAAVAMLGGYQLGSLLAARTGWPPVAVAAGIIALGALVCFPTLAVFIFAQTTARVLVLPEDARAFSARSAAAATAGLAAMGILAALRLGFLSVLVFVALAVLAGRLRRRYLPGA